MGSKPLSLMVGEARKAMSALAVSGSLAPTTMPAEKIVIFCSSAGSGPTRSIPAMAFNSLT